MEQLSKQEKLRMIRAGAAELINALWAGGSEHSYPFPQAFGSDKGVSRRESVCVKVSAAPPAPRLLLSEPSYEGGQRNPNSTLDPGLCPLSFSSPCHYL